ncbi:MAG: AAA domain-containing protein [Cyclobacteriaceae bacterium]|nr:AAA domain-containing protein [Cyclobacteriaceae bacterium]
MRNVLKSYQKRLVNLSSNNKSLLLRKLLKGQYIDVHKFDFLQKEASFSIIRKLIEGKTNIDLTPVADSRDENVNLVSRDLTRLERLNKFLFDEHGSRDLYVGWPFVRGKFSDGTHIHAPLLFFPVALLKSDKKWSLTHRSDVNVALNKSFLLAYGYYNGISIDEEMTERNLEDFDTDHLVFRTSLYQFFKESQIEINFNSDNFADILQSFSEFNKQSFDELHKDGELKLFPEAVLGIFPQSGSYLVPDYEKIQNESIFSDLEEFFASKHSTSEEETKYTFLNRVREDVTYTPLKMDAFQENALKAAKLGKSFVVQGPPGTGKSQLITNLISDFVARGKRVLLVSQKRAALDVVFDRFDALDMQQFMGLVHDFRNDRKSIYEKIAKQIDKIEEYKQLNNSLDSIQLERQFGQYSKQIDSLTEEMEEFRSALFDESECGVSVKELYLTSDLNETSVNVKQEYQYFKFNDIIDLVSSSKRYAAYAAVFRTENYPLLDRKNFSSYDLSSLKRMQEFIEEIPRVREAIAAQTQSIINHPIEIEECISILGKKERAKELLSKTHNPEVYGLFRQLVKVHTRDTDYTWLADHERLLMNCFNGVGVEQSLSQEEIGPIQASLQVAIESRRNVFKYIKWWVFSKDRKKVNKVLITNQLKTNRIGIKALIQMIDSRLNLGHNLSILHRKGWVSKYEGEITKGALQNWFHSLKEAFRSKIIFYSYRNFKEYFNTGLLSYEEFSDKINSVYQVIDNIPEAWNRWSIYFTENQLRKITSDKEWLSKIEEALNNDFDDLCDFDKLREELPNYQIKVANEIVLAMGAFEDQKFESILVNSLKLQWIDHIETKYPVLRAVSSRKFKQMEADLQNNIREKLRISNEILLLKARERIYEHIEYNRLNNMVTYREIKHQVTKKRRIWPVRKLIANHSEELFDLIPCWMASPEAVSAIFPMERLFDIVIFDEASQCFTERGIPAMFRGNQLVIAGDSQQLRPNDLYKPRWDDTEEEDIALEVDSLLELSEKYLMNIQLKGHYRSKKAELIAFSNTHFYQDGLRLLPDRLLVNKHEPAIKYIKVDGVWENNTNRVEADKVIELIKQHIKLTPQKSIGIITFNAKQQELILDLLDEEVIAGTLELPSNLMVKNIENVQGDERDIIIFSTAYAPTKSGKLMMQFGSLNIAGGENRLNVAVTRAREGIMMVSSILPDQLKVENVKNNGPKLLKAYLVFAKLVSDGKYEPKPYTPSRSNANWYLKNSIINWASDAYPNLEFKDELPFADITIKKGEDYAALLLTDDDLYLQNPSVKDLHAYTPFTLSKNNWRFIGVFSREWWKKKEDVQEAIARFLNQHLPDE